jgi:acyl carrier protein
MSILKWFRPPNRPGLRYSDEAYAWASTHFPESHQKIAAIAAGILCEQTGASFSTLRASTHFIEDMGVYDFFDAIDYAGAIQHEFQLLIPEPELAKIRRISDLVDYLYERVAKQPI